MAAPWEQPVQQRNLSPNVARNRLRIPNNQNFAPNQMHHRFSRPFSPQTFGQTSQHHHLDAACPPVQEFQNDQHGMLQPNFMQGENPQQQLPTSNLLSFQSRFPATQMHQNRPTQSMMKYGNAKSHLGFAGQQFNQDQRMPQNFQHPVQHNPFQNRNQHPSQMMHSQNQLVEAEFLKDQHKFSESVAGPSSLQENVERKAGKEWIRNWLAKRKIEKKRDKLSRSMTLPEAKDQTRVMIILLAKLQKQKQQLESMKHEDQSIWGQKLVEVQKIQAEFEALHQKLVSPETVQVLKRKIAQRQSKRRRLKQQRQEQHARQEEEVAIRQKKEEEIDRYMEQAKLQIERQKQEEAMKKEGDQILGEVKKKISEATKSVQLLEDLQKLRKLRIDRFDRQGVLGSYEGLGTSNSQRFEDAVHSMIEMLSSQLQTYQAEEAALKVLLETEHEETREKEKEKQRQKEDEHRLKEQKREQKILFGQHKEPVPGDPLYPYFEYYRMAETSLKALIAIRHDWDMYLAVPDTPGASQIPSFWVQPAEPSSDDWKSALQDRI